MQPLHGRQHVRLPPRACRQIWRATCTTIGIQEEPDTQVQRLRICRTNQVLQGVERQTQEGERIMKNITIDARYVNVQDNNTSFEYRINGYFSVEMNVNESDLNALMEEMDENEIIYFLEAKGYKIEKE